MAVNARDSILIVQDHNGTERTLTCDLNSIRYRTAIPISETETFCDVEKSTGNMNVSFTLGGLFTVTSGQVNYVFDGRKREGTARLYKYYPAGSGTGAVVYSGLAFLGNYEIGAEAGSQVEISAEFAVDGDDFMTVL